MQSYLNYETEPDYANPLASSYTRKYVYDGEDIILELDSNDKPVAGYVHGSGIDEPLFMVRDNNLYSYTRDALGSIKAIYEAADSSGIDTINLFNYTAYGVPSLTRIAKGNSAEAIPGEPSSGGLANNEFGVKSHLENPYAFTGRELDAEAGLYYYRARFYDAYTGRFISEDPIRYRAGVNFYNYVGNNPILFSDPYGLMSDRDFLGCIIVGGGLAIVGGACHPLLAAPGLVMIYKCHTNYNYHNVTKPIDKSNPGNQQQPPNTSG